MSDHDYLIGRDMGRLENRMDQLEEKVEVMGAETQAALVELDSSLQEVADELDALAGTVAASDSSTATEIRTRAQRLRDLRPDTTIPVDPQPGDGTAGGAPDLPTSRRRPN